MCGLWSVLRRQLLRLQCCLHSAPAAHRHPLRPRPLTSRVDGAQDSADVREKLASCTRAALVAFSEGLLKQARTQERHSAPQQLQGMREAGSRSA